MNTLRPDADTVRVLIYAMNYAPEPTGVGLYTGDIGSYLARSGARVDVVTATPHYPGWVVRQGYRNFYSREILNATAIIRCPLYLASNVQGLTRFLAPASFAITSGLIAIWKILTIRPHVVFCVEPTLSIAPIAIIASKLVGARLILHIQDLEVDAAFSVGHLKSSTIRRAAFLAEAALLRAFDSIVTISNRMKEKIVAKGISADRIHLIRNWVHLSEIKNLNRPSIYRAEMGFSAEEFVVLYAGNIGPKQALPLVLDAAAALIKEKKIKFVLVGDGPEKRRLMDRYGDLDNVKFLPVQPKERLCELLNLADVHVLPQEAGIADLVLPSKLGGMLATEKPCIIMAAPGTELYEFVGEGSIIVPPGDAGALAKTIRSVFMNRSNGSYWGDNRSRVSSLSAEERLSELCDVILSKP